MKVAVSILEADLSILAEELNSVLIARVDTIRLNVSGPRNKNGFVASGDVKSSYGRMIFISPSKLSSP